MGARADGRYALSEEMEAELRKDVAEEMLTRREIREKYNISATKVWNLFNEEKARRNYEVRKAMGNPYYEKDKNNVYQRRYRAKKAGVQES